MNTKSRKTGPVRSKIAAALAVATTMAVVACASSDYDAPEALGTASSALVTPQTTIGDVTFVAPPEAAPVSGTFAGWRAVPGLSGAIQAAAGSNLAISVTAETFGPVGPFLRARVD